MITRGYILWELDVVIVFSSLISFPRYLARVFLYLCDLVPRQFSVQRQIMLNKFSLNNRFCCYFYYYCNLRKRAWLCVFHHRMDLFLAAAEENL